MGIGSASVSRGTAYYTDYKATAADAEARISQGLPVEEDPELAATEQPPVEPPVVDLYTDPARTPVNLQGGTQTVDQALAEANAALAAESSANGQTTPPPVISTNVDEALAQANAAMAAEQATGGAPAQTESSGEAPSEDDDAKAQGKKTVDDFVFAPSNAPIRATTIPKFKDPNIEGQVDVRDVASLFNGVSFDKPKSESAQTLQLRNGGGIAV